MKPFIPRRFEAIVFGLLLSGMMSFLVSGMATVLAQGVDRYSIVLWMTAWLPSWAIAFPTVLAVAPVVRRILHRLVIVDDVT